MPNWMKSGRQDRSVHWTTTISVVIYVGVLAAGMAYFIFFHERENPELCNWTWADATPGPVCVIAKK